MLSAVPSPFLAKGVDRRDRIRAGGALSTAITEEALQMAKGTIKTRGTRGGNKNASQLWSGKPTTTQLSSFQQKVQAFDWPQFQQLQQQYHQKETEFNSIILQGMQLGLHTHTMLAQIGQTGRGANKSTRNTSTKRSQAGQKGGRASARARGPNQQSGSLSATG